MTTRDLDVLKKLAERKKISQRQSLQDKISTDYSQAILRQTYKPLLEGQEKQTASVAKKQQEQIERQQEQLDKQEAVVREIKKQPLVVPLIKSLRSQPRILEVLKGNSDGTDLTEDERYILRELEGVDDKILKICIDFYSLVPEDKQGDLMSESGIFSTATDSVAQSRLPGLSEDDRRELVESHLTVSEKIKEEIDLGRRIYSDIMSHQNDKNKISILKGLMESGYSVGDRKISSAHVKEALMSYLDSVDYKADLRHYPWTNIKTIDPAFYNDIDKNKKAKHGKGFTQFLTSDPGELVHRLEILHAEKDAGNTNVLNEASAIIDELRRQGIINISKVKTLSKMFH